MFCIEVTDSVYVFVPGCMCAFPAHTCLAFWSGSPAGQSNSIKECESWNGDEKKKIPKQKHATHRRTFVERDKNIKKSTAYICKHHPL